MDGAGAEGLEEGEGAGAEPLPVMYMSSTRLARIVDDVLAEQCDAHYHWCCAALEQLSAHNKESTFTELWIRYGLEALRYWTSSFRMWSYKVLKCLSGLEHYGYANALPDGSAEADRGDACPPSQLVADCRSQAVIDDWSNTVREKALDTLYDSIDANFPADEPPSQAEKDRLQQLRNWMRQSRGQQPPTFTLPSKDELLKRLRDYHTTAVASLGESCVARALAVAGQKADDAIAVQNGNDGTASGKSTPSTRQQQPPRKQSMRNSDASDAVRTKQRQGAYPPREDALKWTRERSATARKANGAVAMHHSERVEGVSRSRRKGPRRKEGDDTEEEEEDDEYSGQEGQEAAEAKRVAKAKAVASKDKRMIHDEDEEENDEDGDNDEQDVNGGEFEFSRSTPGGGISVAKSTGKGKKIGWYDGEAEEGIEATPKSSEKPHSTTKKRKKSGDKSGSPKEPKVRRVRHRWTQAESDKLVELVRKHGAHDWKRILELGREDFEPSRRPPDLKDKWRNLVKHGHVTPENL